MQSRTVAVVHEPPPAPLMEAYLTALNSEQQTYQMATVVGQNNYSADAVGQANQQQSIHEASDNYHRYYPDQYTPDRTSQV